MDTQDAIRALGLNNKEAALYKSLLELGEASVLKLAQHAGVKRPTAYLVLDSLESRGFAVRVMRAKKTVFTPKHPLALLRDAEFRLNELRDAVPILESLLSPNKQRPRVLIYEGRERLDMAYDDAFVIKGEILFMGTLKLSLEAFPRTFKKGHYLIFSSDFLMREVLDDSPETRAYAKSVSGLYRSVRYLRKEFLPFEIDIGIFGNRVLITSVKYELFTVSLESDEIAKAFRTIFEIMWQSAKE